MLTWLLASLIVISLLAIPVIFEAVFYLEEQKS
jgi:hypothetical protein